MVSNKRVKEYGMLSVESGHGLTCILVHMNMDFGLRKVADFLQQLKNCQLFKKNM
jgi:hypothetical protein